MNVKELIVRLRIEEDNKSSKKKLFNPRVTKVNIVEHGQSSKNYKTNVGSFGGKMAELGPKESISKKKSQGKCFNFDKVGHKSSKCRLPKKKKEANAVDYIVHDMSEMNLAAVISEVKMWVLTQKNGGLTPELRGMNVLMKNYLWLLKQLRMERSVYGKFSNF